MDYNSDDAINSEDAINIVDYNSDDEEDSGSERSLKRDKKDPIEVS